MTDKYPAIDAVPCEDSSHDGEVVLLEIRCEDCGHVSKKLSVMFDIYPMPVVVCRDCARGEVPVCMKCGSTNHLMQLDSLEMSK